MATETFGPSALATPANAVTLSRLLATPFVLAVIANRGPSWLTFIVWAVFAGTDGLDGFLARRHGTTRSGAFLDPLADKFLVLGAMFVLVAHNILWWAPVAIIAGRELLISMYRSVLGSRGVSVPARASAKAKTLVQSVAVGFAIMPTTAHHPVVYVTFLWLGVILAVVSAAQYLLEGRPTRAL